MKANSSYCWRSIAEARIIICRGARWRVGDGTSIKIWSDSWLPRDHFYKVLSHIPMGVEHDTTVNCLFNEDENTSWNLKLIHSIFSEEKATLIRSILLSLFKQLDTLICMGEKNDIFTTKSAYHVAQSCGVIFGDEPSGSTMNVDIKYLWKALWTAHVQGKIKICVR